jgi:hypothetical protein
VDPFGTCVNLCMRRLNSEARQGRRRRGRPRAYHRPVQCGRGQCERRLHDVPERLRALDAESDANGNPADNGDSVQVWTCDGGTNQRWNFNENNGSYGTVTNDDGGLCLDAQSDATHSPGDTGDRVQLWKCNGGAQQEWRPGTLSNGAVVLVNLESSILLDGNSLLLQATSDNTHSPLTPGDPVELWQSNSSLAQHWSYDS